MRDVPPAITAAAPYPADRYANPPRTWQLIMTGNITTPLPPELDADLGRLLDLRPDIGSLAIETDDGGGMLVARDWPSDRMEEADALLARIEAAPGVRMVTVQPRAEPAR